MSEGRQEPPGVGVDDEVDELVELEARQRHREEDEDEDGDDDRGLRAPVPQPGRDGDGARARVLPDERVVDDRLVELRARGEGLAQALEVSRRARGLVEAGLVRVGLDLGAARPEGARRARLVGDRPLTASSGAAVSGRMRRLPRSRWTSLARGVQRRT